MVRKCVIQGCESKTSVAEHRGVTYHSIPFDAKTREIWKKNCKLDTDKIITKNVLVCSRHFRRVDFQQIKGNKFILIQGAVPTIFPWGKIEQNADLKATKSDTAASVEATIAQIMADTAELNALAGIKSKFHLKRLSTDVLEDRPSKAIRLSKGDISTKSPSVSPTSCEDISKTDVSNSFTPGSWLEALEFDGNWQSVKVIEVDNDEGEVLIQFEKSRGKSGGQSAHEWIPMNSSRLRPKSEPIIKAPLTFSVGEKCFAKWTGSRKFPATVQQVLGNDEYEVLFDDGFIKLAKGKDISKIKLANDGKNTSKFSTSRPASSSKSTKLIKGSKQAAAAAASSTPTVSKPKNQSTNDWPLISMSSLNLEELYLPEIPKDGEWCCHWVNDQPIGREGFLQVGDHKKPTVIVDDWRLPPNWVKHMYQRSNVLGKWDVILVNPDVKRFRSKADLKTFIEEQGGVYNPDVYDFSIHRRRAKDIGAYVFTKDYKPPPPPKPKAVATELSPVVDTSIIASALESTPLNETPVVEDLPPADLMTTSEPEKEKEETKEEVKDSPLSPLQEGYVYVGALKVQLVDNLFRCPEPNCNKNFRKENHLQIHVKHYHEDLAKSLGVCPNMQDLASKRTLGTPTIDSHPRNQISNQIFFTKLHQQDLKSLKQPRSNTPKPLTPPTPITSPVHITTDSVVTNEALSQILGSPVATPSPTAVESMSTPTFIQHPTGDSLLSPILPPNETPKVSVKKRRIDSSIRKNNRQRFTKKVVKSTKIVDNDSILNDLEDTRHSFNGTPEQKSPGLVNKGSNQTLSMTTNESTPLLVSTSESLVDVTNTSTSSLPDGGDSPKYMNENGETIKIVRMRQEEIINCLCSYGEEDGLMIQCELCLCWQHGICNGIEKESQVPEKYVCYICRNPERGRSSLKYVHDQDWLFEGKLPTASYHQENPNIEEHVNLLKKSHTLTGNLHEINHFMHSLRMKIKIAQNKDHPKLYLWAKKWEESTSADNNIKSEEPIKKEVEDDEKIKIEDIKDVKIKTDDSETDIKSKDTSSTNPPNIPQPEAPIDPVECQGRLWEHIKTQQSYVKDRLAEIETQVFEIESMDNIPDLKSADYIKVNETISTILKNLDTMTNIAKINTAANETLKLASPVRVEKTPKFI